MSIPVRVCIVAPEFVGPFPNGGVGTACYWEAQVLGQAGYDVTVLYTGTTVKETPAYWTAHYEETAPFRYVDLDAWADEHRSELTAVAASEAGAPEAHVADLVFAWLRTQEFDLVLAQEFLGHAGRALQARAAGYALSHRAAVTLHSCRQWVFEGMRQLPSSPHDMVVDFLERESARLADLVVAPSAHMADWARAHWKIDDSVVVPYCYDPEATRPREVVEHRGPFTHLVFFGRLETRKGLHLFCRALAGGRVRGVEKVTFLGKHSRVEGVPSDQFIERECASLPGVEIDIVSNLGSLEALAWLQSQRGVLVVAPSLVDNLPYALIELYSHRIPFVSNRIGGIPEIVGESNSHVLAEPTVNGLADTLERVIDAGTLTIDYRDGYDVADANARHVAMVAALAARPIEEGETRANRGFHVVVSDAGDQAAVEAQRRRVGDVEPLALTGTWMSAAEWSSIAEQGPAVVLDSRIEPQPGLLTRLLEGASIPGAGIVTSYYRKGDEIVQPLGRCLEAGWQSNVFGGPCFAVGVEALGVLRELARSHALAPWRIYAAIAVRGGNVAVIPEVLYGVADAADPHERFDLVHGVAREYATERPADLDLEWMLKSAGVRKAAAGVNEHGRVLYEMLLSAPDEDVRAASGLDTGLLGDPQLEVFAQIRARLAPFLAEWEQSRARVFIYGAGLHTRMLLGLMPEIGPYVGGFIDRRPMATFLGKPCVHPQEFRNETADVILYSSREHESDMFETMQHFAVDHVRLYGPAVPLVPRDEVSRVSRRFGARRVDPGPVCRMFNPPAWATGHISHDDAMFVYEMIQATRPQTVLELGVASGASSAAILYALDQLPAPESRRLISADVRPTCYFDPSRATGEAVSEMYPAAMAHWELGTLHTAARLLAERAPRSIDLLFIDANHSHPWPTLDLLHLAPLMRPGAWILLHDVELPRVYPQFQSWGPHFLYQAWPFNKVHQIGPVSNIAAVQLPADLSALTPMALALVERAWEHTPDECHVNLPPVFEPVQRAIAGRLRKTEAHAVA